MSSVPNPETIRVVGVVYANGAPQGVELSCRPPAGGFPPNTRVVLGLLVDPAQPQHVAPFTLVEHPRDDGASWYAAVTQPPEIQRSELPHESGGILDPEDDNFLPRPTQLLGLNALRPVPPEPTQPFRLDR
jgi:hypothetical protein